MNVIVSYIEIKRGRTMPRRSWRFSEEKILIENYETKTIMELKDLLPGRSDDMINSKIKRLRAAGRLAKQKNTDTVKRAYLQRNLNKEDS